MENPLLVQLAYARAATTLSLGLRVFDQTLQKKGVGTRVHVLQIPEEGYVMHALSIQAYGARCNKKQAAVVLPQLCSAISKHEYPKSYTNPKFECSNGSNVLRIVFVTI